MTEEIEKVKETKGDTKLWLTFRCPSCHKMGLYDPETEEELTLEEWTNYIDTHDEYSLVRGQSGFPSVGEIIAPFQHTYLVAGWMRGSHWGPFMPVGLKDSKCTVFDGPPRIVCLGVQISNGKLAADDDGNPLVVDFFEDVAFNGARQEAIQMSQFLRRMGEFEPARLGPEAMEYTTLPQVLKALEPRFKKNK